jgi:uncharacterized protein YuzE
MRTTYDSMTDTLTIILASTPVEESDEINPGVIFDYDKEGNIVGLEILDASQRVENPNSMEFNVYQSSFVPKNKFQMLQPSR